MLKTDNIACNTRQGDDRQCRAESPGRGDFQGLRQERSMDQTETNRSVGARHDQCVLPLERKFHTQGKWCLHGASLNQRTRRRMQAVLSSHRRERDPQDGTHHKATITWNKSIAVCAMKTHMGSPWLLHATVPSRQQSCCVLNSHSQGKNSLDTRGQNTAIRPGLTPAKMLVLTL